MVRVRLGCPCSGIRELRERLPANRINATRGPGAFRSALGSMRQAKVVLRWIALLGGIGWGLAWLNSAVAFAWAASGPPNPNPEGWLFGAVTALIWAGTGIAAGITVFVALRPSGAPKRLTAVLLLVTATLAVLPEAREFLAKDRCLDAGGQWSHA